MHLTARPCRAGRWAIVALGAALALTAAACSDDGASTATTSAPTATSTTPAATTTDGDDHIAEQVDVDGRSLYLECRGTGSPTVVLQSGYGNAGDIWSLTDTTTPAVLPAVAETNRVCVYDRPGSAISTTNANGTVTSGDTLRPGRSGGAPSAPRDPVEVVTELHDLLAAADVPGPYVLVGHSLGGTFDVLYARTYPTEVAGLVIVDSPLPPLRDALGAELFEHGRRMSSDPSLLPGYESEAYDLGTLFDEIAAAGPLADIPVIVVRRGAPTMSDDPLPEDLPFTPGDIEALTTAQWDGQVQWAASVPGAEVITVPDTGHYVQTQRPDAVVDAIRSVASRSGGPPTTAPVTTTKTGADTQADFAGLVDIGGGRKMYLECHGQGSPTVVLLTGYRDTARVWDADLPGVPQPHVLPAVAGFTRVCAYDRPGTVGPYTDDPAQPSRSDAVPQPHAPDDVVADLHALLAAADVPGPYVVAGHSLGGAYARLYAATYPDQVVGVVLIDAFNEFYRAAFTPEQWAPLLAFMGTPPPGLDYPDLERADLDAVLDAVERAVAAQPLPELPLVVLTRTVEQDLPPELTADLPPGLLEAQADAGPPSQAQLAALVPDARHVMAAESGHYIQLEQPALVIEAIRQVVEGVRHPNTWSDLVSCCAP